jgi:hypothetical protein
MVHTLINLCSVIVPCRSWRQGCLCKTKSFVDIRQRKDFLESYSPACGLSRDRDSKETAPVGGEEGKEEEGETMLNIRNVVGVVTGTIGVSAATLSLIKHHTTVGCMLVIISVMSKPLPCIRDGYVLVIIIIATPQALYPY